MMKLITFGLLLVSSFLFAQHKEIRLIVRADDIGFCHAANEAIIKVYKKGIARSAEVIVPAPWFMEAVQLLNANPGVDVGIHLCLSSEWNNIKWRPMTQASSLVDSNGYFYPFLWPNEIFPRNSGNFLMEGKPDIVEIEKEFRKQIETGKRLIKNVSHISTHMGCDYINSEVTETVKRLAYEYNLFYETPKYVNRLKGVDIVEGSSFKEKENQMMEFLKRLESGTHILITHPCLYSDESKQIGHNHEMNVGFIRNMEAELLMSSKILKLIQERNIKLITVRESFPAGKALRAP